MADGEWRALFEQYGNMVYRLALSYLGNRQDAEDTVQSVFIKLLEGKARIIAGKERALLTQMTVNHCKDLLRLFRRQKAEPLDETMVFVEEVDRALFVAVMSLGSKYRVVVYLHYYEGYSFGEIAALLGIGQSAVSMRLHRARIILKAKLGGDGYEK